MPDAGQGRGLPLRVLVAVPAGTALVALCEAAVQTSRLGLHAGSLVLVLALALLLGLWPSALAALVVALLDRRFPLLHPKVAALGRRGHSLAAPLLAGVVAVALAWWAVPRIVGLFASRSVDFSESLTLLWRGAVLVGVPLTVVGVVVASRWIDRVLPEAAKRYAGGLALLLLAFAAGLHLCSGPFVNYYGGLIPWVVWPLASFAVATLVPARVKVADLKGGLIVGGAMIGVFGLGAVGLHHRGARALVLHDTRGFPRIFDPLVAMFDGDGDGDLPPFLGGTDCDGSRATVSGLRPEIPDNGVDDNCFGGDAAPWPLAKDASAVDRSGVALPVVLITVDAVRADHLELYGYARETMPFLTHYASTGRVFERAYSPSNHTSFSMLSILSGQSPEYLMHTPESFESGGQRYTHWLPQRFAAAGYETWAVSPALFPTGELSTADSYFDRVMLGPWDHAPKNRGTQSKQIFDWLTAELLARDEGAKPLFIWVHVPDPHGVHESHQYFGPGEVTDAYDDELRWTDLNVAHLISVLNELYGDQFIFALSSDHGEAFGERGEYGHGYSLYEDQIHVPLVLTAPGLVPGRETRPVSLVGLGPGLLALAGLSTVGTETAPSLLEPGAPVVASCPYFFSEARYDVALIGERYKIIRNRSRGTEVVFDLQNDPQETHNLAPHDPQLANTLATQLSQALETPH